MSDFPDAVLRSQLVGGPARQTKAVASTAFRHLPTSNFAYDFRALAGSEDPHILQFGEKLVKLRVALVDDHPDFLKAFVAVLAREFDIVVTARDGRSALEQILRSKPDVAVLDLQLPDIDGIELTRRLTSCGSVLAVVICSVVKDQDIVEEALEAGAKGYVLKERIASDLIEAVRSAALGRHFVSAKY